MSALVLMAGFAGGAVLGAISGRDLAGSVSRIVGSGRKLGAVLGFVRRMGLLTIGFFVALNWGGAALAGMAAGYLAGFGGIIALKVRENVL